MTRDDLSQWSAYPGRAPRFSIGFDPIAHKALSDRVEFSLKDCSYDSAGLRDKLRELVNTWIGAMEQQEEVRRTWSDMPNSILFGWLTDTTRRRSLATHPPLNSPWLACNSSNDLNQHMPNQAIRL